MWTPPWQGPFRHVSKSVGCSHMSGLCVRPIWPLALMNSADRIPNHAIALYLALVSTGFSDPRPDRFASIVVCPSQLCSRAFSALIVFDQAGTAR